MNHPGMPVATFVEDSFTQLRARRLPQWAVPACALGALALATLVIALPGLGGLVLTGVVAALLFLGSLFVAAYRVEGPRPARNRLATAAIYSAFVIAVLPLLSVTATLLSKGSSSINGTFLYHSMRNIGSKDPGGGAYHAIVGTLEQAGIATLMTVPLGVLGAVYIVEYGRGPLATAIRFFVDVMTGIPSIVAGLFVLAFWVFVVTPAISPDGKPHYSGFAAALALSVLMLPTVVRSTEEMLRLVPGALREGAYALGIPKWRAIVRIVLPTAAPGIVTGVMLAVARACGETAPVLLVAGGFDSINFDPFGGSQSSLSYFVFQQATKASTYAESRAWGAALTLVALVLVLTVSAKLLARRTTLTR